MGNRQIFLGHVLRLLVRLAGFLRCAALGVAVTELGNVTLVAELIEKPQKKCTLSVLSGVFVPQEGQEV